MGASVALSVGIVERGSISVGAAVVGAVDAVGAVGMAARIGTPAPSVSNTPKLSRDLLPCSASSVQQLRGDTQEAEQELTRRKARTANKGIFKANFSSQ